MSILLTVTSIPVTITGGTYSAFATALNTGVWRFTFTPSQASTAYTGGNFHSLIAQEHGGLWLDDTHLELYTTPNDTLCFSQALTWSAGQAITVKIDTRSGTRSITISGATTGNGTFSYSTAGPYFDGSLDVEIGRQGGGTNFQFLGTISSFDDGTNGFTADGGTFTLTGGPAVFRRSLKLGAAGGSFSLTGGPAAFVTGKSINAAGGSFALTGGPAVFRRALKFQADGGSFALTGGDASLMTGTALSLGAHTFDFQKFGFANRSANLVLNTQASGSVVIISSGGKSSDITQTWTNSLGSVTKVSTVVDYPDFAGYGTQIGKAAGGGTGQTFHIPVSTDDENTSFATEVIVTGTPRVTAVNANVSNSSGGSTVTSANITVDGPAFLIADWWGSSPVVPPFSSPSPGVGTPYTAVPNNGFTVIDSYLVNNEFGEVQAARAVKMVPAAGTYNVTWTHSPNQGAQTWIIAVQAPASITAGPGTFALTGGDAVFQITKVATGTAAGTSTATGVGVSAAASSGTAAGSSSVTGVGASTATTSGTAVGSSTASGVGVGIFSASGTAAGSSSTVGLGAATAAASGSSTGSSSVQGTGASVAASSGTAAGLSGTTGTGASLAASSGTAVGSSTATGSGGGVSPSSGIATGSSSAIGVGASLSASSGTSAGSSSTQGSGASLAASSGSADGLAVVSGTGSSLAASTGIAAGVGVAFGSTSGAVSSSGVASGTSTASGVGASLAASAGSSSGTSATSGAGASTNTAAGTATGSGSAVGIGTSIFISSGLAIGIGGTIATGASRAAASGLASGVGTAFGTSENAPGSSTGISAGSGAAFGIGASIFASAGVAVGVGVAFGSGPAVTPPKNAPRILGSRSVPLHPQFVRKRRSR